MDKSAVTRAASVGVRLLMAVVAKRATVIYREPESWEESEWFDVVGIEVATSVIAAPNASVVVSREHRLSPQAVLKRSADE